MTRKSAIVPAIEPIPPATAQRKRHLAWLALLAILILALAGDSIYKFYARKTLVSPASEGAANNVLVLAEFTNTSGDAVFDHTLRQGLSSQLEQSPFLNLLSDQRIAQTLSLMAQPKDIRLTRELAARSLFAYGKRGQHRRLRLQPGQSVCAGHYRR